MLAFCQFCFGQCIFIQRERLIRLQIPVQNINIGIIFALVMDPDVGHRKHPMENFVFFFLRTASTSKHSLISMSLMAR